MSVMVFLIIVGVIGLAGIGACLHAVATDGYGRARTRGAFFLRTEFDYAEFHAQASPGVREAAPSAESTAGAPAAAAEVDFLAVPSRSDDLAVAEAASLAQSFENYPTSIAARTGDRSEERAATNGDARTVGSAGAEAAA
ncbi:hypothetical protein [Subtercola sp. YIM 133946]|uniref:hypothetical protein n=1 Tax=Subtercola sp. YIM 133946 TaxID=3118909 RepID=UPI002F9591BB